MAQNSDSDDSSDELFVRYEDRPEWADLRPVLQDDGANPVCVINYTEKFKNTFDMFRAVLAADERSERAFRLTNDCAQLNPANYTVWYFRRVLLKELAKDLGEELDYLDDMITKNEKNYQVWHHRKVIVELLNDGSREKHFTNTILDRDNKNYHAWQHRQWAIEHFKLFDDELDYTLSMINMDVRNNSAWNHRYYVISRTLGFEKIYEHELNLCKERIRMAPNNDSAWNYVRGVIEAAKRSLFDMAEFCEQLYSEDCRAGQLLSFMVDLCEEQLVSKGKVAEGDSEVGSWTLKRALELTDSLAQEHDTIRENYWNYIKNRLIKQFE